MIEIDTRDLGVLMFLCLTGLPFALGFVLGFKAARFQLNWPVISFRWPWNRD